MESILKPLLLALAALVMMALPAAAHPHVFVTAKSEMIYAPDGAISGLRHAWTFDESFSASATMGLEQKEKGKFSREELKSLTEINVQGLKDYDYFTYLNGTAGGFNDATDSWFSYDNGELTLHFTVMLKKPIKAKTVDLEVYDQEYMVDFKFAKVEPLKLVNAPAACKAAVVGPKDLSAGKRLSEQTFQNSSTNWGQQFADKVTVKC